MNPPDSAPRAASTAWWAALDPRESLAARAALVIAGGTLAFVLVLSWSAGALVQGQLERHLGSELETLAYQFGDKLDRAVYERSREVQFATGLAAFRDADQPAAERRRVLEAVLDASPDFAWLGFADPAGRITSASQGFWEKSDASMKGWFRSARDLPYTSELHEAPELARSISRGGSEPLRFITLAAPVLDQDGRFLGVIAGELKWTFARDALASMLNEAARRAHVGLAIYAANGENLLDSGTSGWTEPPRAPVVSDSRAYRGSFWEHVEGDSAYLTGFARSRGFREFRGLGIMIAARRSDADVFAPVRELRRSVLQWGLLFAAALAVAAWNFASRITRRLLAVGAAAQRIRLGDVLTLLPHAGNDQELTRMCHELDLMVEDFRGKIAKLDRSVPTPGIFTEPSKRERDLSKYV